MNTFDSDKHVPLTEAREILGLSPAQMRSLEQRRVLVKIALKAVTVAYDRQLVLAARRVLPRFGYVMPTGGAARWEPRVPRDVYNLALANNDELLKENGLLRERLRAITEVVKEGKK